MDNSTQIDKFIVVIDDDPVMRLSCEKILKKDGYQVETYEDGAHGLTGIEKNKPDLLVVDLKMPKIGGMEVIKRVHEIDAEICIVVITGYATIGTAVEAMKAGAYDFLPKPFTPDELRLIVKRGMERRELSQKTLQLKREKENLERRFLTFVSHQLQSPLVAVQQYLEVLNHLGDVPDRERLQQEWINKSLNRIKELIEMVRDWLTISKIESGNFAECTESLVLQPVIKQALETYEGMAAEKKVKLSAEMPDEPITIKAHEECLRMVLANLIHNAIKYNKVRGAVTVAISKSAEAVTIQVSDTGIGIPEDKIGLIFDEFYRVKCDETRNISGTGLGLAICKKIMQEFGVTIHVSSKQNKGSTFTLTFKNDSSSVQS